MTEEVAIGVDIGGTKIHFAVVDRQGKIIHDRIDPTPAREGADQIMHAVLSGIGSMAAFIELAADPILHCRGVGIGSAGQIDFRTGSVQFAVDTLPGWTGMQIREIVQQRYPLPVYVDNDVNVIALAEKCYGSGIGLQHFICLALGTGVGGAIVVADQIVHGSFGGAGELGHVSVDFNGPRCSCGNYGCLELYASGTGIARVASEMAERHGWHVPWAASSRSVIQAWLAEDRHAVQVMDTVFRALSSGISGLIHIFNPQAVILGGGVAEVGERFITELRERAASRTSPSMWRDVQLLPAKVGNKSGVIGAAAQIWYYGLGEHGQHGDVKDVESVKGVEDVKNVGGVEDVKGVKDHGGGLRRD